LDDLQKRQIIDEAWTYWQSGEPLRAGMIIFEHLPLKNRPSWAADLLGIAYYHFPDVPEVDAVVEFARYPGDWYPLRYREAHMIFDRVRQLSLQVNNFDSDEKDLLRLAEYTAKITYTSRQYPAPFDHNAGWYIVQELHSIVKRLALDEDAIRAKVTGERFSFLAEPICCHPACPLCQRHGPRWDYWNS
jgi:hypothetical protein